MIRTIMTLALGILIGVLILNYLSKRNGIDNNAIINLQKQNDSLLRTNQKIDSTNYILHKQLKEEDNQIATLTEKDIYQESIIKDLNTRIKTLNNKYEKASKYSNNFNNNEISSYFSNLR